MEDRYEKGMNVLREINKENIENLFEDLEDIAPDLGRFVVEFPYSEIYTRKEVDLKTRELCTVAAITALGHAQKELYDHVHAALKVGNSPKEIVEIIMQMSAYAGFPAAINGMMTAKKVFKELDLLPIKKEE
ncbi:MULTISPECIES: carboxymuconolactone decarboxylase family protein [Methanobrevibacter]|jgi:4-carboxymuconolactone decarboxylase|uniref:carboxymuconolactone decarboxylase family protein n=1 Tax=Methanobrevibacter TaxID=2172 RepID=UPI003763983A|nr:carboxymuconolactone decarboxylase family protein [Methanobacteriaceae archaeon]